MYGGVPKKESQGDQGYLYVCDLKTGRDVFVYTDYRFGTYSTPLIYGSLAIFAALDRRIYALDLLTQKVAWSTDLGARCFSSSMLIAHGGQDMVCIGANNGRLYFIDPKTGAVRGVTHLTERILNRVVYDSEKDIIYVPTQANEIYALQVNG
jgi:outer membrane protein assembly factor BamB